MVSAADTTRLPLATLTEALAPGPAPLATKDHHRSAPRAVSHTVMGAVADVVA